MKTSVPTKGLVFNIERFAIDDGPGIRDLVFMKGCPLRCQWCSNPESQNPYPEISYSEDRCITYQECGKCTEFCSQDAITMSDEGKIKIDRKRCVNCKNCAEVCPARAIRVLGDYLSIDELLKIIEEDSPFYRRSGGGVTVGGGEPLFQAEFVAKLLKQCRNIGVSTAIETCGYASWGDVEKVCRHANLILYDIKHMNSNKHKIFTGVDNELILENVKRLSHLLPEIPIIIRIPVLPGINDSEENIRATLDFVRHCRDKVEYELLPYHSFGKPKYRQLGREYPLSDIKVPTSIDIERLRGFCTKD